MEKENATEKDWCPDNYWFYIILMMVFGFGSFGGTDHALREEVAELKGKVSILEKLAVADRRS